MRIFRLEEIAHLHLHAGASVPALIAPLATTYLSTKKNPFETLFLHLFSTLTTASLLLIIAVRYHVDGNCYNENENIILPRLDFRTDL